MADEQPPAEWNWKIGQDHLALAHPAQLFLAYHPRDEELLIELEAHLSVLKRQGLIESWHAGLIPPGDAWEARLLEKLERSDFVLLLVSADFLSSDLHINILAQRAFIHLEAGNISVIPIKIRHVDFDGTPLSKLQSLPDNGRPVKSWHDRDEAWLNVANGIRRAIREQAERNTRGSESEKNSTTEQDSEATILNKALLPRFRDGQFLTAWDFLQIQQSINAIECIAKMRTTKFDPFYNGQFLTAEVLNQLVPPIKNLILEHGHYYVFKHFPASDGIHLTEEILNELIDKINWIIRLRLSKNK